MNFILTRRNRCTCNLNEEDFFRLYNPQSGGAKGDDGAVYFKSGIARQRGQGIGGIFGSLLRRLLPFLYKTVLPQALGVASNVVTDLANGKRNFSDSIKEHGLNGIKAVGNSIIAQSGSGKRRKRKQHKSTLHHLHRPKKFKKSKFQGIF